MSDTDCQNCPTLKVVTNQLGLQQKELENIRKAHTKGLQDLVKTVDNKVSDALGMTLEVAEKAAVAAQAASDAIGDRSADFDDKKDERENKYKLYLAILGAIVTLLSGFLGAIGYFQVIQ